MDKVFIFPFPLPIWACPLQWKREGKRGEIERDGRGESEGKKIYTF